MAYLAEDVLRLRNDSYEISDIMKTCQRLGPVDKQQKLTIESMYLQIQI